jgi:hypothetical protein
MKRIGLYPSSTGEQGGKETGFRMSHYIMKDGAFEKAFAEMPKEFQLPWTGVLVLETKAPAQKRSKYHCAACDFNTYSSKADLKIICGTCNHELIEEAK